MTDKIMEDLIEIGFDELPPGPVAWISRNGGADPESDHPRGG
jgi:hypothetical protein